VEAARNTVGAESVNDAVAPMMISEDFGAFLQAVPGAFVFIGNGESGTAGGVPLHNNRYDFNDEVLTTGARYFAELARIALPRF
jgi:hippurate hydrolase